MPRRPAGSTPPPRPPACTSRCESGLEVAVDASVWAQRAGEADIGVQALSDFSSDGTHAGLVLGFGAIEVRLIEPGIRLLARLVK